MKKSNKIQLVVLAVLVAAALVVCVISLWKNREQTVEVMGDVSWYDEKGKEFTITTMEELYGVAQLSESYNFQGQTIKLGADIVVNEGEAEDWEKRAPKYLWTPITGFAGHFDGQGHTISGIYGDSIITSLGLFTDTKKTCVIKDLKLVNSRFQNNNDMGTGSIIGFGGGKLENVYSDAQIVGSGQNVGGFIGRVVVKGENRISSCWFDGKITMKGTAASDVGGLAGSFSVADAINAIEHSLSTAEIECMGIRVGGLCGNVGSKSYLNLSDSMYSGNLTYDKNKYDSVGSGVGQIAGSSTVMIKDTYTISEIANRTIGTDKGYVTGSIIAVAGKHLKDLGGYQWTTLDFDTYWAVQRDAMPILSQFADNKENVTGTDRMVDISWYDPAGASFVLNTEEEFYGFAYLSRSYDFRGQTIQLGADITINEGNARDWGKKPPEYEWTPIAWHGTSLSKRFKGTFDGQGHTISGIYVKGNETNGYIGLFGEIYNGATVKNFRIVNSYFEGTMKSSVRGCVGSVVGRNRGTIDSVYSNAVIVNSAKMTGGIAGMINGTGADRITNCWFDGTLTGVSRCGGILGGVYGNKQNLTATIENCLNTGEIAVKIGYGDAAGICGIVETWATLYVKDCLNAGTFKTVGDDKKANTHIGTLVGSVTQTSGVGSRAVITNSFGVREFYSKPVGWKYDAEGILMTAVAMVDAKDLDGVGGYQWTTLDFEKNWMAQAKGVPIPATLATSRTSLANVVRMVDYSWYNNTGTEFTLKNAKQLYAFANLWDMTNLFKDQTIRLGADITVNIGNAQEWAKNAPEFAWMPAKLRGTFDGQGHTISGIYVKGGAEDNYVGLFHRIYQGAVVKNLKLENSYIEGTMAAGARGATGSIAGRCNGTIDGVYSNAIVANSARMTGGLVGMVSAEGQNLIQNSWFDGQITGINRTGGILGAVYGNKENIKVKIAHCLNTGKIAVAIGSGDVGGMCGMVETGGTLLLKDSLNTGTFATIGEDKKANTHIGNLIGSVTKTGDIGSKAVVSDSYGVKEFYSKLIGWSYAADAVSQSSVVLTNRKQLAGYGGYQWTTLDFKNSWAVRTEEIPVPVCFAANRPSLSGVARMVDYSWYDPNKNVLTLQNLQQWNGFATLCNADSDYFKGKTIQLGADITVNQGDASQWEQQAPAFTWTPLSLKGTFDGQGHTISGVYAKTTSTYTGLFNTIYSGGVVKNLKLVNSYFEGTKGKTTRSGVGSIVGRNNGTIDTVYSSAIIKNSALMTGGIAGMVIDSETSRITNCWYDGQIHAIGSSGGILGGTYGTADTKTNATIEHCLNTGVLYIQAGSSAVGGLCGYIQNVSKGNLKDSLNAGNVVMTGTGGIKQLGTLLGALHAKASLKTDNAYGVEEFSEKLLGYSAGNETMAQSAVRKTEVIKGYGAYQWTSLDLEKYWVLREDEIPALAVFKEAGLDLSEAKKLVDYSWYDPNQEVYTISTVQQLSGFRALCNVDTDYFKGKTIRLGADITVNNGKAEEWGKKAPEDIWTPLSLKGTFDGQGHTISGVYAKTTSTYTGLFHTIYKGAAVKSLRLVNSYFEGTKGKTTRSGVGSVAGLNLGTIDGVYSEAIVKNSALMTGGIAGMVYDSTESLIQNCWFNGQIHAIGSTGGILGGTYGAAGKDTTAAIEHCLNTGVLNIVTGSGDVGGLCGYVQNISSLKLKDSLNAGSLVSAGDGKVSGKIGVIGSLHAKATLEVSNVYGAEEFSVKLVGYNGGKQTTSQFELRKLEQMKGKDADKQMTLDFEHHWLLREAEIPIPVVFGKTNLSRTETKK